MSRQIGSRKRSYDQTLMNQAVAAVQSKSMSLRAAARAYAVPRSTLFDKVTNRTPLAPSPRTILSAAEEQKLVEWTLHMGQIGYGRTRNELLDMVTHHLY